MSLFFLYTEEYNSVLNIISCKPILNGTKNHKIPLRPVVLYIKCMQLKNIMYESTLATGHI